MLICATNSVRALGSAFLRHGRFDYVILIGHPGPAAREAIWDRYLSAISHGELDMAAIVEESRLFTPADIEFAVGRTAQLAFERVMFEGGEQEVTTSDIRRLRTPSGPLARQRLASTAEPDQVISPVRRADRRSGRIAAQLDITSVIGPAL